MGGKANVEGKVDIDEVELKSKQISQSDHELLGWLVWSLTTQSTLLGYVEPVSLPDHTVSGQA